MPASVGSAPPIDSSTRPVGPLSDGRDGASGGGSETLDSPRTLQHYLSLSVSALIHIDSIE